MHQGGMVEDMYLIYVYICYVVTIFEFLKCVTPLVCIISAGLLLARLTVVKASHQSYTYRPPMSPVCSPGRRPFTPPADTHFQKGRQKYE